MSASCTKTVKIDPGYVDPMSARRDLTRVNQSLISSARRLPKACSEAVRKIK